MRLVAWPHLIVLRPRRVQIPPQPKSPPGWVKSTNGYFIDREPKRLEGQEGWVRRTSVRVVWHETWGRPTYLSHVPVPDVGRFVSLGRDRVGEPLEPASPKKDRAWKVLVDCWRLPSGKLARWPQRFTQRVRDAHGGQSLDVIAYEPPWALGRLVGLAYGRVSPTKLLAIGTLWVES